MATPGAGWGKTVGADRVVGGVDEGDTVVDWLSIHQTLGHRPHFSSAFCHVRWRLTAEYAREREQFDRPDRQLPGRRPTTRRRLHRHQGPAPDADAGRVAVGRGPARRTWTCGRRRSGRPKPDIASHTPRCTCTAVSASTRTTRAPVLSGRQADRVRGGRRHRSASGHRPGTGRHARLTRDCACSQRRPSRSCLAPLTEVDDRGVYSGAGRDGEVSFVSWRNHIQDGADLAALLRARLDPDRPPHVGVLLGNTPFFCTVLVAAALSGIVPVGLNPTRRGAALQRDIDHADCQLVLADRRTLQAPGISAIDVDSARIRRRSRHPPRERPSTFPDADPDDLFMLLFTSGTSGDPKAVRCTHEKVAFPGIMLATRFGLGPADTCYLSMPLFHSNAIMAGWASGGGGGRVNRVAPQVLRVGILSGRAAVRRDVRQLRRQAAVLHPGHHPTPPMTPTIRCGSPTETRVPPGSGPVRPAVRCAGGRRLRHQRGRGVHRAHPGHPGRRAGPTGRRRDHRRRRHGRGMPTGCRRRTGEHRRPRPVPRLLQG